MKNRATDEPLFVIIFTLLPVNSEGKPIMDAPEDDEQAQSEKPAAATGDDDELD